MNVAVRQLESELLDELPADAPEAVHSRGDLRRINALMGNARWLARTANKLQLQSPKTLFELAAGDGVLMLRLLEKTGWRPERLILLDQQPVVSAQTLKALEQHCGTVQVVTADVFEWLSEPAAPKADLVTTNLFLHHFTDERLKVLLQLIAGKSAAFIACEPRRSGFALFNTKLLGLIGCNHVTRHDAAISVKAGFAGDELTRLWPMDAPWSVCECSRGMFSHCFGTRSQGGAL